MIPYRERMKLIAQVKLNPTPHQAAALLHTFVAHSICWQRVRLTSQHRTWWIPRLGLITDTNHVIAKRLVQQAKRGFPRSG